MLEKLREILGLLSGYKQQYDATKADLEKTKAIITEAELIVDNILGIVKGWDGTNNEAE